MKIRILIFTAWFLILGADVFAEMFLHSNGNTGIGTNTPTQKLSVNGTIESETGGIMFPDGTVQTTAATVETDPTVLESVKDGVSWTEVLSRPSGLDDGDDVGITSETDPKIGINTTNYIPNWDGSELVSGTIFDNGKIGIGTSNPLTKLDIYSPVAITDWWPWDAYMLRLESGSVAYPLNTIQIIKSYGWAESELRFDNGDDILAAIYTLSNDTSLKFLVASPEWYHVTFDTDSSGDLGIHLRAETIDAAALVFNTSWDPNATAYASKIYRPSNSNNLVVNFSGIGDVMTFDSLNGNVGIGTASPQSSLQVEGYVQLALTSGYPPLLDCDEASERGRMKVDNSAGLLFICIDSGWISK